jgi:peptidase S46-like protein
MRVADEGVETLLLTAYLDEVKSLNDRDAPGRMPAGRGANPRGRGGPDAPGMDRQPERIEVSPGKALLNGKSTKEVAAEVMKATALKDPAARLKLAGNKEAARKSDDALLHLVAIIEESAQKLRKRHDESIGVLETTAAEKIAQYRFKLFGAAEYPDATGTPRMEFGTVKGYTDRAGVLMPYADTFSGLYYRAANEGPYLVPPRWVEARKAIDEVKALDFVTTCDIGGGDYGGAVVNRAGELVGVTFDGNLESLPDSFLYTDEQARAVHVAAQGIAEALRKVYRAQGLIDELGIKESPPAPNALR